MTIKTLSEVLAEMGEAPVSANSTSAPKILDESNFYQLTTTAPAFAKKENRRSRTTPKAANIKKPVTDKSTNPPPKTAIIPSNSQSNIQQAADLDLADKLNTPKLIKKHKTRQQHHDDTPKIAGLLNDAKQGQTSAVINEKLAHALQNVAIEPIYQNDKAINYMRWLAFYYLSNRELSQKQLRQKLLDKECDPQMVDELLVEFAQKDYQSDERCAFMLIREGVRRGRGKHHIAQSLKTADINLPYSLDELIQMADIASLSDGTILADDDDKPEQINWLKLAVEARCKKYGNHLPIDQKQKARQLRFLQYRGFEMSVCFDALKYTLDDMDELDFA